MGSALCIGMEGKKATQEVVPRQEEVQVLSWLGQPSQELHREEQVPECPYPEPHGCEVTVSGVVCLTGDLVTPHQGICTDIYIVMVLPLRHLGQVEPSEGGGEGARRNQGDFLGLRGVWEQNSVWRETIPCWLLLLGQESVPCLDSEHFGIKDISVSRRQSRAAKDPSSGAS